MTLEIDGFSAIDSIANWALTSGIWNGRKVDWSDASDFLKETQIRIQTLLLDPSDHLAAQFAYLASSEATRSILSSDIVALRISDEGSVIEAGFGKSASKFWKKHKKEILIGAAIAVVLTVIVVVAVCSNGVATGTATAAGAAALTQVNDLQSPPPVPRSIPKPIPNLVSEPVPISLPKFPDTPRNLVFQEKGLFLDGQYTTYTAILADQASLPRIESPPSPNPPLPQSIPSRERSWTGYFLETIGRGILETELLRDVPPPVIASSTRFSTLGERQPHLRIGGINGMNNTMEEAVSNANYISRIASNQSIDWVYNHSNGPVIDLAEIFTLNYPGYSPKTADLLKENWTAFHQANKDRPHAKYLHFCHSQGAIHTRNALGGLPKEIRDRVIVVAIAPGAIVPKESCFFSLNYASKKDFVHLGEIVFAGMHDTNEYSPSKMIEKVYEDRAELILLEPHPHAEGIDHAYQSPTFKDVIEQKIGEYLINQGEYR